MAGKRKKHFAIGLPYATVKWIVADSGEQSEESEDKTVAMFLLEAVIWAIRIRAAQKRGGAVFVREDEDGPLVEMTKKVSDDDPIAKFINGLEF